MQKINKDVKFPLELDLLPYMSSNENPEVSETSLTFCSVKLRFQCPNCNRQSCSYSVYSGFH